MNKLKTGYGESVITPKLNSAIEGYYVPRYSKGTLSDLKSIAFAISFDKTKVLLVSLDLCIVDAHAIATIKNAVKEKTGISTDNVIITATHTHTGPCVKANNFFLCEEEPIKEYLNFVAEKTADACYFALNNLVPTKMGYSVVKAPDRIAYIRRYKMKDGTTQTCPVINDTNIDHPIGTLDQRVNVLRFDRENAESVIIMNYGLHADTVNGELISSDWIGWVQDTISKCLNGAKCICIMGAQGDVGSTNVHPTKSDMNDTEISFDNEMKSPGMARFVGRALAGAILQVYDKVEYIDVDVVKLINEEIMVELNVPDKKDLPLAHEYTNLHKQGKDHLIPYKGMELTTVVAEAMRMVKLENSPKEKSIVLTGLRLGNVALLGIPGEPFTEIGVKIKEIGGFGLIIPCALTNGYEGYFPSKQAFLEGGYEARTSVYKPSVYDKIISTAEKILKNL